MDLRLVLCCLSLILEILSHYLFRFCLLLHSLLLLLGFQLHVCFILSSSSLVHCSFASFSSICIISIDLSSLLMILSPVVESTHESVVNIFLLLCLSFPAFSFLSLLVNSLFYYYSFKVSQNLLLKYKETIKYTLWYLFMEKNNSQW